MGRRATTIEEFGERMSHFVSPESIARAQRFQPSRSDVVIATYPKAGTTWMQQIVHGLRTRGDMDFDEITAVTPWIELAFDLGWDLDAEQVTNPRVYKSHWNGEQVPATCRRICVIRDPADTMKSFYDFMTGWVIEPGTVSVDAFARHIADRAHASGSYWHHLLSFWRLRRDTSVLILAFEDLKEDLPGQVRRVAEFIGLGRDEAAIEIATAQASFAFMKAHESRFDDHLIARARNGPCGLPADARSTKVRHGEVGRAQRVLSSETRALLDLRWSQSVRAETGIESYAKLRAALRA